MNKWKDIVKRQQKLYLPSKQTNLKLQPIDELEFNPEILAESQERKRIKELEEKREQFQSKREEMKKPGQKTLDARKSWGEELRDNQWFNILKMGEWADELLSQFAWDKLIESNVMENEAEIVITHPLNSEFIEQFKDKFTIKFMDYNKSPLKPRYKYSIKRDE